MKEIMWDISWQNIVMFMASIPKSKEKDRPEEISDLSELEGLV